MFLKILGARHSVFFTGFYVDATGLALTALYALFTGGVKKHLRTSRLPLHILRGLVMTGTYFLFIYTLQHLPLASAYTLIFAAPFLTALLAVPAHKEKVSRHCWIAIGLGFAGVLIAQRPGLESFTLPAAAGLLAALCFAVSNLLVKPMEKTETPLSFAFYGIAISVPFGAGILYFTGGLAPPPVEDIGFFLGAGASMFAGMVLIVRAFAMAPAALAAPFQYTQIVWGAALGYLVFGDVPELWTYTGAAVIIAGGLYLIYGERVKNGTAD